MPIPRGLEAAVPALAQSWQKITHVGTAIDMAVILENLITSKHPMEVILSGKTSATLAANSTRVRYPNDETLGIYSWAESPEAANMPASNWNDTSGHAAPIMLLGTNSLMSTTYTSSGGVKAPRLILMPGDVLEEVSTTFATNRDLQLMYRYITEVEISQ